ncbi:MAG: DUF4352 domain-containing protein [Fimbriimonas sp.]|nr:DUF4352 domain-containing protein [Fimbriimonas sp.]
MRVIACLFAALSAACCFAGQDAKPIPGTDAVPIKPYRIGPYQIVLTSAKFATRVFTQDDAWLADKGKKFVVVNFTVQNPSKEKLAFERSSLSYKVVGADTNNYEMEPSLVNPETMASITMDILPAQKIPCQVFFQVPSNDPIYKLMVRYQEGPVLRYDLRGKTLKSDSLFADKTGVILADSAQVKIGQKIEIGYFTLVVDGIEESTSPIGPISPDDGKKIVIAKLTITNPAFKEHTMERSTYKWQMLDENGENLDFSENLIKVSSTDTVMQSIEPGRSLRVRVAFYAPKESKPATFIIQEPDGRSISVSLK